MNVVTRKVPLLRSESNSRAWPRKSFILVAQGAEHERVEKRGPRQPLTERNPQQGTNGTSKSNQIAKPRLLVVDDELHIQELLQRLLTAEGYHCTAVSTGEAALSLLEQEPFDLLLVDVMMPGMSGMDLLTVMGTLFPHIPVILVTGVDDRDTAITALELGARGYLIKPFNKTEVVVSVASALQQSRQEKLTAKHECFLEELLQRKTGELVSREKEIVRRLLAALGQRDGKTGAHAKRVGMYAALLAKELGWPPERQDLIRRAAVLHDVGKIAIPDSILNKPGPLTPEEFGIVKTHTEIGARLLSGSQIPVLRMGEEIALTHHERWDGSGYPRGLVGESIPESGRIVAVADVYDSLTRHRVYRPALSEEKAISAMIIGNNVFDPRVFDAFLRVAHQFRNIRQQVKDHEHSVQLKT